MEGDYLEESEPTTEKRSYTDIFNEHFPYYLSFGMTYDEFYNGDVYLTRAYAKAENLRLQRENELAWIKGMYVYEAFSVVEYNLNRGKGKPALNYAEKPYPIFRDEVRKSKKDIMIEEKERAKVWLMNFVNSYKR